MFDPKRLLMYEYFPSELPPCFNTKSLAENQEKVFDAISTIGRNYSIPLKYSGYKSETSRRKFAIPNPYHYCKAIQLLVDNQDELKNIFNASPFSLTAPKKEQQKTSKLTQSVPTVLLKVKKQLNTVSKITNMRFV